VTPAHLTHKLALAALAVALAVAALATSSCASSSGLPTEPVGIIGQVVSLVPGDGRPDSIRVDGPVGQPAGAAADKAQVSILTSTQFFDAKGKRGDPATIKVGTPVRVWFEGPVAESYPVQGSAKAVEILDQ
jgi:beta-N-acetylhexosaminidase